MAGEATRRRGETLLGVMWVSVFLFETCSLSGFCCGLPLWVEAQSFSGHRQIALRRPMFVICEGVLSLLGPLWNKRLESWQWRNRRIHKEVCLTEC